MIEAMRAASLPSSWPTSTSVPAGGERHEDVEDRQIEVERRVRAEAILVGGGEDVDAPVHVTQRSRA